MKWLELVFDGIKLYESAVWFIGGLILGGCGLLLLAESYLFRKRAYKVHVRVLGVIPNTKNEKIRPHYYPVLEFLTRDGQLLQMKRPVACNPAQFVPEKSIPFLVDPEDSYELRSLVPTGMIVGVSLMLSSLVLFKISDVVGRSLLWAAGIAVLLIVGWFVKVLLFQFEVPHEQEEPPKKSSEFRLRHSKRPPEKFELSEILSEEQHRSVVEKQDKSTLRWMPVVVIIAIGLLAFGGYRGYQRGYLTFQGESTVGKVIRVESDSKHASAEVTYYSVVQFSLPNDEKLEFRDQFGSNSPIDEKGDEVKVIYDLADPKGALIDRGAWSWLLPVGCLAAGLLIFYWQFKFAMGYFRRRKSHS